MADAAHRQRERLVRRGRAYAPLLQIRDEARIDAEAAGTASGETSRSTRAVEPPGIAHQREADRLARAGQLRDAEPLQIRDRPVVGPHALAALTPDALDGELDLALLHHGAVSVDAPVDAVRLRRRLQRGCGRRGRASSNGTRGDKLAPSEGDSS